MSEVVWGVSAEEDYAAALQGYGTPLGLLRDIVRWWRRRR